MEYLLYGELYSTDITELDLSGKNLTYIDSNIKWFARDGIKILNWLKKYY